jgi:hypothetical protein
MAAQGQLFGPLGNQRKPGSRFTKPGRYYTPIRRGSDAFMRDQSYYGFNPTRELSDEDRQFIRDQNAMIRAREGRARR